MMRFFKWVRLFQGKSPAHGQPASSIRRRARLEVEPLEDRALMSGTTISGFVFNDVNHNGLFDAGEPVIANSPVRLVDATGALVATTTTDANGYYKFDHDPRVNTTPSTTP